MVSGHRPAIPDEPSVPQHGRACLFRTGTVVALRAMALVAAVPNRDERSTLRRDERQKRRSRARDSGPYEAPPFRFGDHTATLVAPSSAPAALAQPEGIAARRSRKRPWNYCYSCERTPSGRIRRNLAARRAFIRQHPCPATSWPCGTYVIDHIVPLKRGGTDVQSNVQSQNVEDARAKYRFRRGHRYFR